MIPWSDFYITIQDKVAFWNKSRNFIWLNVLQSGLNRVGRFDFVINAPFRYQSFFLIIQEFAKFEGIIVAILFIILSFEEIIVVCNCNRAEFNSSMTDMKIIPTTSNVCFVSSFAFSLSYSIIFWEIQCCFYINTIIVVIIFTYSYKKQNWKSYV